LSNNGEPWREKLSQVSGLIAANDEARRRAKNAIACLRQGSPPKESVQEITVGFERIKQVFESKLDIARSGGSCFTLVNGGYGTGKSHSLYWIREVALSRGYLVSLVTLSTRECPLDDLGAIYERIAGNIEGKIGVGTRSLLDLVDAWVKTLRLAGPESINKATQSIKVLHEDFRKVLAEYISAGSSEQTEMAGRWLVGNDSTKRTANALGVQLRATNEHALRMLNELGKLGRQIGHSGLVVLFDEAEAIPSYRGSSRQKLCYDNLCRLIEKSNDVRYCYFVYATTPLFFEKSRKYLPISESSEHVVEMPKLTIAEFALLGKKIRDLYIIGESWPGWLAHINDSEVERCVTTYDKENARAAGPRVFVRSIVSALDICSSNHAMKLSNVYSPVSDG